jgi:hypothetical protein
VYNCADACTAPTERAKEERESAQRSELLCVLKSESAQRSEPHLQSAQGSELLLQSAQRPIRSCAYSEGRAVAGVESMRPAHGIESIPVERRGGGGAMTHVETTPATAGVESRHPSHGITHTTSHQFSIEEAGSLLGG